MKLCVALDLENHQKCLDLANEIKDFDVWLKVGMRAYYRDGAQFIKELKSIGNFKIFLDLKLYDIPNTMCDASLELAKMGADMINVHASAGSVALCAVMNELKNAFGDKRPIVLAVSALTSFDENGFKQIYNNDIESAVRQMSLISRNAGIDGMVCSAYESKMIKDACGDDFITLCPGIRPILSGEQTNADDQNRVAGISFAKAHKADFIVVGRPIYKAPNPKLAVKEILSQF